MEGRGSRGRGGSWKRGGRGGSDSDGSGSGEHRGRGRGGHHRGRGKRDHYRGRGRGGAGRAADFHQRERGEDDMFEEEEEEDSRAAAAAFSRRKLESNWDRYEASEKAEADDDAPARRGADFGVLLESAGDSFSQFRFAEEKEWEMDPFIGTQMSLVSLDLHALAETLQQLPLHERLSLEAELLEVATPAELPAVPVAAKPDVPKTSKFVVPPSPDRRVPTATAAAAKEEEEEEADEELEQLLSFQKRVVGAAGESASGAEQEVAAAEQSGEDVKEEVTEEKKEEEEEVKDVAPPEAVKQEMTEEDLEDWLDSMIS